MNLTGSNHYSKLILTLLMLLIVLVSVNACAVANTAAPQQQPSSGGLVIRYLTAPKQVAPSKGADIFCVATDQDNIVLNYKWSAAEGTIEARKDPENVLWIAPSKEGSYTVTVEVTNAKGDKAIESVGILVSKVPDPHPVIYSLTCRDCKDGVAASRFSEYLITCDASAPGGGELHYTWFATIGKIKGQGSSAILYTLSQYGNALITVIVTDDKGNEAEGYLALNISCCK